MIKTSRSLWVRLRPEPERDHEFDETPEQLKNQEAQRAVILSLEHFGYRPDLGANAVQGNCESCPAAGMNDYVSKPIQAKELPSALERAAK